MTANDLVLRLNNTVYSLTINQSISGTASSDALIGTPDYKTNLYATPNEGAQLSGWNVTGGTITNNIFTFGNADATIEPVFKEYVPPAYTEGWIFTTVGQCGWTLDPAPGVGKYMCMTTTQIGGDYVSSFNTSNMESDQLYIFAPSAGTWHATWDNMNEYTSTTSLHHDFGDFDSTNMREVIAIDFFGKQAAYYCLPESVTNLPSSTDCLFNTNNLTSVNEFASNLSFDRTFTGALIPFITAMNAACPNLSNKQAFYAYTVSQASDYNEAISNYPEWFNMG